MAQNFEQGSSSASDLKKRDAVKPEDIKLEFGEERKRQETEGSQAQEHIDSYFGKTQSGVNLQQKF